MIDSVRDDMNQPTGTVAFLFTDVEGSTKLWQDFPAAMRDALAAHDKLVRAAIESHGGWVFKTVGDAFCASFPTVSAAVSAALTAEQSLTQRPNGPKTPRPILRVRMAIHAGAAEERDGDYFGQPVNRVARILSSAHGGQILLSNAAEQLARDCLPEGVSLRSLGEHRLRDLREAEKLFQLLHPSLEAEFPPLRSLAGFPNNLKLQLTSFIGREEEMKEAKRLLGEARLLTLAGSGGCGKTRLALQVAADCLEQYPDGVWLVELASITDPALVPQSIASALSIREESERSIEEALTAYLASKRLLLVLDNCEHLVESCATLADSLLRHCANMQILATSRESLGVPGEIRFSVPPLDLPDPTTTDVDSLRKYESVELLVERAGRAEPRFRLDTNSADAVIRICRRLDGIPLALELAAARVKALSLQQIADRLDDRFRLLTGGSRTAAKRQQTLVATIDWSYDLLTAGERELLIRLSVFSGGWTTEAAVVVCADPEADLDEAQIVDSLQGLVEKSMAIAEVEAGKIVRFRLLETIREYARQRLDGSDSAESVHDRHLGYFLGLAEEAVPHYTAADQAEWLNRIETEHNNMRAAIEWCRRDAKHAESGLLLTGAVARFWHFRGYLWEGRRRVAEAMHLGRDGSPSRGWAVARNGAGILAWAQSDLPTAEKEFQQAALIWKELSDRRGLAASLSNLGLVATDAEQSERARVLLEQSLLIRRDLQDTAGVAICLNNLGRIAHMESDYTRARELYEESLSLVRQLDNRAGAAICLANLGDLAASTGEDQEALHLYQESLSIARDVGDRRGMAVTLLNLGQLAEKTADTLTAGKHYGESLALFNELGDAQYSSSVRIRLELLRNPNPV